MSDRAARLTLKDIGPGTPRGGRVIGIMLPGYFKDTRTDSERQVPPYVATQVAKSR